MMDTHAKDRLRAALEGLLAARGHREPLGEKDALFSSGRLDSLAATELIVLLESGFGLDLSDADFDIAELDSLAEIAALVDRCS